MHFEKPAAVYSSFQSLEIHPRNIYIYHIFAQAVQASFVVFGEYEVKFQKADKPVCSRNNVRPISGKIQILYQILAWKWDCNRLRPEATRNRLRFAAYLIRMFRFERVLPLVSRVADIVCNSRFYCCSYLNLFKTASKQTEWQKTKHATKHGYQFRKPVHFVAGRSPPKCRKAFLG